MRQKNTFSIFSRSLNIFVAKQTNEQKSYRRTTPRLMPDLFSRTVERQFASSVRAIRRRTIFFLANCLIINSFYVILSLILEWCTLETARLNLSHLPCRHAQDERFFRSARPSRYSYRHEMQGVTTTKNKQMYNLN